MSGGRLPISSWKRTVPANGSGRVFVHKVPSTPEDQSLGVIQGVREICAEAGVRPGDIEQIVHGTTIATNTVIEYSGAEVGMLTTRGFRDILHMARHKRPHNFSMQFDVPWQSRPLVKSAATAFPSPSASCRRTAASRSGSTRTRCAPPPSS